ncbi:hypothetical protein HOLleu_39130 [Holothuria leucospilota]|uniref:Uncharacterized protein n=1 Tax=Holothuria leucospilota TaxID=206669 RepID=A0A9Q1BEN6_HOLLE|nr:hypothetical protein HOLleu_39130 [Holothuria leucospilota]
MMSLYNAFTITPVWGIHIVFHAPHNGAPSTMIDPLVTTTHNMGADYSVSRLPVSSTLPDFTYGFSRLILMQNPNYKRIMTIVALGAASAGINEVTFSRLTDKRPAYGVLSQNSGEK